MKPNPQPGSSCSRRPPTWLREASSTVSAGEDRRSPESPGLQEAHEVAGGADHAATARLERAFVEGARGREDEVVDAMRLAHAYRPRIAVGVGNGEPFRVHRRRRSCRPCRAVP